MKVRYGDVEVPVLERRWRSTPEVNGYRPIHTMRPGDRWDTLAWDERFIEHLVDLDGVPAPVGIAIAGELMDEGADWAYLTDIWRAGSKVVLLDRDGICVAPVPAVSDLIARLVAANNGQVGGLPDVIGARGDIVILREAKRRGRDRLGPRQHAFARAAQALLDDRLDLAVVEWDLPPPTPD